MTFREIHSVHRRRESEQHASTREPVTPPTKLEGDGSGMPWLTPLVGFRSARGELRPVTSNRPPRRNIEALFDLTARNLTRQPPRRAITER
jgi:hypothetical protein